MTWYSNSQSVYFLLLCILMWEHLIAQFGTYSSNSPVHDPWALVCVWLSWEKEDKLAFFPPTVWTTGTCLSNVNFKMRGKLLVKGRQYKITVHCSKLVPHYHLSKLVLDRKDGTNYEQTYDNSNMGNASFQQDCKTFSPLQVLRYLKH